MAFRGADVPKEIEKLNYKKAVGITPSGHKDTNSMLAERDYGVKCDTGTDPIVIVHGVWVWFCKAHHQPLFMCENERFKASVKDFAEAVQRADKTERYEYGRSDENKNAKGELPPDGTRWATPKELAIEYIHRLKR